MSFSGNGYHCRPVTIEDAYTLLRHRNNPSTWEQLTSSLPIYQHDQLKWVKSLGPDKQYYIVASSSLGKDVGLVRITDIDWQNRNAAVGVDVFQYFRRNGHGQKIFDLVVKYCFDELNLHRLWLLVLESNKAANKIYTRAGFSVEGILAQHIFRHGRYQNYIMMGLLEDEYREHRINAH